MSKRSMRAGAGPDLSAIAAQRYWREDAARTALAALARSGLSLPAFARQHGLSAVRLRRWQRQLALPAGTSRAMEFLPVHVVGAESVEPPSGTWWRSRSSARICDCAWGIASAEVAETMIIPPRYFCSPDGRVLLRLKRPMYDGTREVAFAPLQLLRRLAALVPPARWHQTRYFGVFGPSAWWRRRVVPKAKPSPGPAAAPAALAEPRPLYRLPWSLLLARTFAVEILRCHCGGERKVLAVISEPHAAQEALHSFGLPSTKAGVAPARWPTQDELDLPRDYGGVDPPFFDDVA